MLCHFLIGVPASGKSTFAELLAQSGNDQIISTDSIRKQLYGDATIQGNWLEVEAEVIKQVEISIHKNIPVIYDATNAQRAWRRDFLSKIETKIKGIEWLGWYLNLDTEIAKKWNSQRPRTVPNTIIEKMSEWLKICPPDVAEGFIHIYEIKQPKDCNLLFIQEKLNSLRYF